MVRKRETLQLVMTDHKLVFFPSFLSDNMLGNLHLVNTLLLGVVYGP